MSSPLVLWRILPNGSFTRYYHYYHQILMWWFRNTPCFESWVYWIFCFFPFNLIYFFHTHFRKFFLLSCKYFPKEVVIINPGYWRRRDLQIYLKTFGNQVLYALRFSQSVINLTQVFAAEISAFILLRLVFWKYDYCPWLLCPQQIN